MARGCGCGKMTASTRSMLIKRKAVVAKCVCMCVCGGYWWARGAFLCTRTSRLCGWRGGNGWPFLLTKASRKSAVRVSVQYSYRTRLIPYKFKFQKNAVYFTVVLYEYNVNCCTRTVALVTVEWKLKISVEIFFMVGAWFDSMIFMYDTVIR